MTSIGAIIVTLTLTLNVFLSFVITLEGTIQNNLTKSWRFSNVCGGVPLQHETIIQFHGYSEAIVFGIHSNFTYDRSSRSQVFFKIDVLKKWFSDLNFVKKRFRCKFFPVKFAKLLRIPFLRNASVGCFWYGSETYDMVLFVS